MEYLNKSAIIGKPSKNSLSNETSQKYQNLEKVSENFEYEKRESIILDQQIEELQKELENLNQTNSALYSGSSEYQLRNKVLALEKKLGLETTHLNESRSQNKIIRGEVNGIRKDKTSYHISIKNLNSTIDNLTQRVSAKHDKLSHNMESDLLNQTQLKNLRSKSQKNTNDYSQKFNELSFFITEERERGIKIRKKIEEGISQQIKKPVDAVFITDLLQKLLRNWKRKVIEKKNILDNYMKHIDNLEDAFEQIGKAKGMFSLKEITTALIKSEAQYQEVNNYINKLQAEIDFLTETHDETREIIESYRIAKIEDSEKLISFTQKLRSKQEEFRIKKELKIQELNILKTKFQSIMPEIKKILKSLKTTPLELTSSAKTDIDDISTLNQHNFTIPLGQIEEYICYLQMFLAQKSETEEEVWRSISLLIPNKGRISDLKAVTIKDVIDLKDLYADQELEESKSPILLADLRKRAKKIVNSTTPDPFVGRRSLIV
ncbi:unnamed protein product [Blepharisma stoltei]|uniref:ODAD1 central coiled coil region domain-containing protein n=1 Tax=Blepharisma stoltei TaxID=1481888 RepID=A0AAU9IPT1_9CILI|nr:unnamed protein product [Blepharisma stoltei]